jgi:hypothetical protein
MQSAIGFKMGNIFLLLAMSISGFVFSFFRGWFLALLILFAFPVVLFVIILLSK